ncbi:hypothetical protein HKX48_006082 [Thoreauomyces humboldtii]|nr:hypothetical protein HKX48_006082 [Thoreauomyces humboldtii]
MLRLTCCLALVALVCGQQQPTNPTPTIISTLPGFSAANISVCPALTPRAAVPAVVSDVRPDDIKTFMALGDSISAGLFSGGWSAGKTAALQENREASYASGGSPEVYSIVNFFRHYSPEIAGASTGTNFFEPCYGVLCPFPVVRPTFGYNMALSGALTDDLQREVDMLISTVNQTVQANGSGDQEWKFLTLLIGANDLCLSCTRLLSAETYEARIRAVIERMRTTFPRLIVHISTIFKVSELYAFNQKIAYCRDLRMFGGSVECPCAFLGGNTRLGGSWRQAMDAAADAWNTRAMAIAASYVGLYDDFAVIADPGTGGVSISEFQSDFISDIDCFHPTRKAHAFLARGSWNNLFHTQATKNTALRPEDAMDVYCPVDTDRIQVA